MKRYTKNMALSYFKITVTDLEKNQANNFVLEGGFRVNVEEEIEDEKTMLPHSEAKGFLTYFEAFARQLCTGKIDFSMKNNALKHRFLSRRLENGSMMVERRECKFIIIQPTFLNIRNISLISFEPF